jgi:hypothetical protein
MSWLREFKRTLQELDQKVTQPDGWPVAGLTAFYGLDFPTTRAPIKYISSSGIYLDIQEPLPVGQIVTLRLQMEGHPELSSELEILIQAQAAHQDEFGVRLLFLLPPGLDAALWEFLIRSIATLTNPDQVVRVFRTLRAVLFLCRLCSSGAEEAILLMLDGHLDQDRTTTLFKIAFAAENLLNADPDVDRMRAHPKLVASLLRGGSWAPDELTTQLWVGLLASSCSVDEPDDFNQIFVDLLIQITPRQAVIFTHACERALSSAPATGDFIPASVVLGPDEIVRLTGVHDLTRNATELAYLFNLGLIQNVFDFTSYRDFDRFDITPSRLGLELFRHCRGQRGKIDPQLVADAREHLAVFLPPPIPSVFENFTPFVPDPPQEK